MEEIWNFKKFEILLCDFYCTKLKCSLDVVNTNLQGERRLAFKFKIYPLYSSLENNSFTLFNC